MRKTIFTSFGITLLATVITGCGKSPESIVNDAYKSASENKFGNITAYILPDSIEPFNEAEVEMFTNFVLEGIGIGGNQYASYTVDSVVNNPEGTQASFSVKTNFKDGRSYTETGILRKTPKGNWRLMVDKEATDTTDVYSVSDPEKMTPELMRNLHYATVMTLASRGLPQYQVMAAEILQDGILTSSDILRSLELLKSASAKNYTPSYRLLGDMYNKGYKKIPKNSEEAFQWYLKAAEAGDVKAFNKVAYAYRDGEGTMRDYDKAKEWYEKGILQDDPTCMRALGYMYSPEMKGFETDNAKVFDLWNRAYKAAVKSNNSLEISYCANNIGSCYMNGWGVTKDPTTGIEWYVKAAEAGNGMAMKNLGETYYYGENGVPKDYDKAFYWLTKASKEGQLYAKLLLGECYEYGRGVDMNKAKARDIYRDLVNNNKFRDAEIGYYRLL